MDLEETIGQLKQLGSERNREIFQRHGSGDDVFGVSLAKLNRLRRKIGIDHRLAVQLWGTGNVDARALALLIADPMALSAAQTDRWLKDCTYYLLADLLSSLVAKSPLAFQKMEKWARARREIPRQCGYSVLATLLQSQSHAVPEEWCRKALTQIESQVASSSLRTRKAMQAAVISIGVYKPQLKTEALQTSQSIGELTDSESPSAPHVPSHSPPPSVSVAPLARGSTRRSRRKKGAHSPGGG